MFFRLLIVSVFFVSSLLSIDRVAAQENSLENTSWQLKTIFGFNNSEYTPENPSDYLLRFRLDNRLQIEADCNQAGATWSVEQETMSLTALVTTRKLCIQPSLFKRNSIKDCSTRTTHQHETTNLVYPTPFVPKEIPSKMVLPERRTSMKQPT